MELLIVKQILLVSTSGNVQSTVWRVCILILAYIKGWLAEVLHSHEVQDLRFHYEFLVSLTSWCCDD